jgi:hypothetical protein
LCIEEDTVRATIALFIAAAFFTVTQPVRAGGTSNNLLLSSAWCSFKYNQVTGYSNTMRIRFNKNGTYSTGSRAEGSTSGKYGSYSSQNDAGGAGKWKVVNGELYISEGNGQLVPVRTVVKRNTNGYPIIVADGIEYSQCK